MSTTDTTEGRAVRDVPHGTVTEAQMASIGGIKARHGLEDLACFALLSIFSSREGVCAEPEPVIVQAVLGMGPDAVENALQRLMDGDAIRWSRDRNAWQIEQWVMYPDEGVQRGRFAYFTLPSLALAAAVTRDNPADVHNLCRPAAAAVGAYVLAMLWREAGEVASTPTATHKMLVKPLAGAPGRDALQRALDHLKAPITGLDGTELLPVCGSRMEYRYGRTVEGKREKVRAGKRYAPVRIWTAADAKNAHVGWATTRNLGQLRDAIRQVVD